MRLTRLKAASNEDVRKWLEKSLSLSDYQKDILRHTELIRLSPFYFYEYERNKKISPLWRLTLIIFPFYLLILVVFNPIKWMVTGEWGYGQKFIDNFHSKWMRKLNL